MIQTVLTLLVVLLAGGFLVWRLLPRPLRARITGRKGGGCGCGCGD